MAVSRAQAHAFCAERDAHEASLPALMLPLLPAAVRRATQRLKGKPLPVDLARRDVIWQDVLELHAPPDAHVWASRTPDWSVHAKAKAVPSDLASVAT